MVKRKTVLDQVERAVKKPKTNRKVGKGIKFEELSSVVQDGRLIIEKDDEVYFERLKESKPIVCVGTIMKVYDTKDRNDGIVEIWDETHEECYAFNWKKDMDRVKVRTFVDPIKAPETKLEQIDILVSEGEPIAIKPLVDVTPANPVADDLGIEITQVSDEEFLEAMDSISWAENGHEWKEPVVTSQHPPVFDQEKMREARDKFEKLATNFDPQNVSEKEDK